MITNDVAHTITPSIILNDITDHYPLLCNIRKFRTANVHMNTILYYRDKKNFCPDSFCIELNKSLTEIVCNSNALQFENFDSAFDNFVACISQMIDKCTVRTTKLWTTKISKKTVDYQRYFNFYSKKKIPSSGLCS